MEYLLLEGDSLEVLKGLEENSVDSVVSDPPYGLGKEPDIAEVMTDWVLQGYHEVKSKGGFMGKEWDSFVPQPNLWKEVFRVLKPGGFMLIACGTRTQDWMSASLRFAGFEIRDVICWHYGTGFPKSMDISKAMDKAAGATRVVVSEGKPVKRMIPGADQDKTGSWIKDNGRTFTPQETAPSTEAAKHWSGWGTALKPATEFWTLCRKPLSEKTVSENLLKWGTGGINIDDSRVDFVNAADEKESKVKNQHGDFDSGVRNNNIFGQDDNVRSNYDSTGRFPANLILDEFSADELDRQSGIGKSVSHRGGARFFYVAKASRKERDAGLEGLDFEKELGHNRFDKCLTCGGTILQYPNRPSACTCDEPIRQNNTVKGNFHPTVKPIKLMQYLVRLITPPGGICCDPFNGSGTTGCAIAGMNEDFSYIGIDKESDYIKISEARIEYWKKEKEGIINKT